MSIRTILSEDTTIPLNRTALLTLLRVLPTSLLVEVLSTRGILCTMGGEGPDVAEGLDALVAEQRERRAYAPEPACATCDGRGVVATMRVDGGTIPCPGCQPPLCGICGHRKGHHIAQRSGTMVCRYGAGTTDETSYIPATPQAFLPGNPFLAPDDPAHQGE